MGGTIARLRTGGDRFASINFTHPIRRLFGQSRGVNWGVLFIVAVVVLLLVRPLVMSGLSWHRTASLLQERRAEVHALEQRHAELTETVAFYRTDAFIAEQARTYGMVEPGETTYVIREFVHPDSAGAYAAARLRNATVDSRVSLTPEA